MTVELFLYERSLSKRKPGPRAGRMEQLQSAALWWQGARGVQVECRWVQEGCRWVQVGCPQLKKPVRFKNTKWNSVCFQPLPRVCFCCGYSTSCIPCCRRPHQNAGFYSILHPVALPATGVNFVHLQCNHRARCAEISPLCAGRAPVPCA